MKKQIKATFIGEDGSLGYNFGVEYILEVKCLNNGRLQIIDMARPNGTCTYSNMVKFLDNWNNIKS